MWRSNRVFSNAKPLEPDDTPSRGRPIALEELSALRPFARVNFVAGVQDLGDIHTTQSGANVQRITIRDSSGTATLNAWGKHVDALSVGKFYRFSNMMVKEFGGANTHHAEARRLDRTDGGRRRNRNRPRFVARSCYRRRRRHPLRHGIHIQAHVPCVLARALGRIDGRAGIGHVLGVPYYGFTIQLQAPRYCDSQHSRRRGVDNPTHGRRANIDEDRPSQRGIEGNASQYHHFSSIFSHLKRTDLRKFSNDDIADAPFFKMYFRLLSTCRVRGSRQWLRHPVSLPPRENPSPPLPPRTNPTQRTPPLPPPKNPSPPPPRLRKWRTARVGCRTKAKKNARMRPTTIRARRCAQK